MNYDRLDKLYYKNETIWREQYDRRFNAPFTKHLPFKIKQINRRAEHELFYCFTEEIVALYDDIMVECLRLRSLLDNIPPVGIDQFIHSCLVDEIKAGNDIEGVRSTRKEIRSALDIDSAERPSLRFGGIVNKYLMITGGKKINLNSCSDVRALYDDFLADEIRRADPSDLPDGKFFRKNGVIVLSSKQRTIHCGVLPEEKIIDLMTTALNIFNDKNIPSLIAVGIFHYLFGYIHPFYDGNGRMVRFITSCRLAEILQMPVVALRLSILIKARRKDYYDLFTATTSEFNRGDLTPFIIGTLQFVRAAVVNTAKVLHAKSDDYNRLVKKIGALDARDRTAALLCDVLLQATVFSSAGATMKEICAALDKSENTVAARLKKIPEALLIRHTQSRPYRYKINLAAWDHLGSD